MTKSHRTRIRLEFVYVSDEPTESIPTKLHPVASRDGINGFIVAGLKALGVTEGSIEGGAKWHVTLLPAWQKKKQRKALK